MPGDTTYPRVYVKWFDAYVFNHDGWNELKGIVDEFKEHSLQYNETLGFLIAETDDSVLISGTIADNEMIDYSIAIPKKNITVRHEYKDGAYER